MFAFKTILVPVDFGEPSERALEIGTDLAKQCGASLVVLHVFDIPLSYGGTDLSPAFLNGPMLDAARNELEARVARVRARVPGASMLLAQGTPWREIMRVIADQKVDLVIMGTHGRRWIGRALLGSVTEKVVRLSPVPVLSVRASEVDVDVGC